MSEMPRRDDEEPVRPSPLTRPDHRKGKSPVLFYVIGLLGVLVVATAALWITGILPAALDGIRRPPASTTQKPRAGTATESATPTRTPPAEEETIAPQPQSALAEAEAAVSAAALPYPDPPSVRPQTIRRTSPGRNVVAITLDDGVPFDIRILELFEEKNIRCTTFLTGQAVKANRDIVKRLHEDGFEIANHTWDHPNLTKLSDSEIRSQLRRTQEEISDITGNQAPYMRPPGGSTNKRVEGIAADMGFKVVLWNKSFADTSTYATPQRLYDNVMTDLQPGDIILCHWGGKSTYEALQLILPEMERRGFTPVTVSELLKYSSEAAGTTAFEGGGGAGTGAAGAGGSAAAGGAGAAAGTAGRSAAK